MNIDRVLQVGSRRLAQIVEISPVVQYPVQLRLKIPEALEDSRQLVDGFQKRPAIDADMLPAPRPAAGGYVRIALPGKRAAVLRQDIEYPGLRRLSGGKNAEAVKTGLILGFQGKIPKPVVQLVGNHLKRQRHLTAWGSGDFVHIGGTSFEQYGSWSSDRQYILIFAEKEVGNLSN